VQLSPSDPFRRAFSKIPSWYVGVGVLFALLLMMPVVGVVLSIFNPSKAGFEFFTSVVLPRYVLNTLILSLGVGAGVSAVGVGAAWLVTMCDFPGRRVFDWALVLPLAVPAYVIAYVYTDFLQHAGPVQTLLRELMGWGPRDYWFPDIRSLPGAIIIFILVFYPYVYLLARTGFLEQSARPLEASRSLGAGPWESFFRVALPLARPSIAAGVALALMETLADFGAVAHFGVQTFTTGIYKAWLSMGDRTLAAQLATGLLTFIIVLLAVERLNRTHGASRSSTANFRALPRFKLKGRHALLAWIVCFFPVFVGFLLPTLLLLEMAIADGHALFGTRYIQLTLNSVTLAGTTAFIAVIMALVMTYGVRLKPSRWTQTSVRLAGLGYAIPGSIIAVGILIPLATFDNALDAWMRSTFGVSTGLLFTGTLVALIYAYLVRYMAISLQTVEASMARITPTMDAAGRSLGHSQGSVLRRIHVPMMRGSLVTAGLIVFVEVMKELPATLIMRPFNFDTLAIQAYRLASDERLTEASTASLMIVAAGLAPVILLSRTIRQSRPGQR
jgi:iron(III) transport system permease protein